MSSMMQYLGELIHAVLENKKPGNIPESIQLDELTAIAHNNHMDYFILGALLKTDLPEADKLSLKPYVLHSTMKSMAQVYCLNELGERFEKEGIYHQVLKGSVLKRIYPSPEMREMSDIDVMIYDENLNRAKKVVELMGFTLVESVKHHDIYAKSPFLILELHHSLYDKSVDKFQYEYFKKEKKLNAKEDKKYALQFNPEDFYVYLIAHMAKHFYASGCGIRNLIDVYYYHQQYEGTWDEAKIHNELKLCGLEAFESKIHTLSKVWLGGQNADSFSLKLFDYMLDCGIYGKGENGFWGQFSKQNQNKNIEYQSYVKRWYYFPPAAYMEDDYPWLKKYPFLLVVAWGIRAVHGIFNKDGREKRKMLLNIQSEEVNNLNEIYINMKLNFNKD